MQADVFSVIADPTRRRIVQLLAEQTHTVGAVVEKLRMSQPTVSKHLKVLREAGVVSSTVEGQHRLYSLNIEAFAEVTTWVDAVLKVFAHSAATGFATAGFPDEEAPSAVTTGGASSEYAGHADAGNVEIEHSDAIIPQAPTVAGVPDIVPGVEQLADEEDTTAGAVLNTITSSDIRNAVQNAKLDAGTGSESVSRIVPNSKLMAEPSRSVDVQTTDPDSAHVSAHDGRDDVDEKVVIDKPQDGSEFTKAEEVSQGLIPLRPFTPSNFSGEPGADEPLQADTDTSDELNGKAQPARTGEEQATDLEHQEDAGVVVTGRHAAVTGRHARIDDDPAESAQSYEAKDSSQVDDDSAVQGAKASEDAPVAATGRHAQVIAYPVEVDEVDMDRVEVVDPVAEVAAQSGQHQQGQPAGSGAEHGTVERGEEELGTTEHGDAQTRSAENAEAEPAGSEPGAVENTTGESTADSASLAGATVQDAATENTARASKDAAEPGATGVQPAASESSVESTSAHESAHRSAEAATTQAAQAAGEEKSESAETFGKADDEKAAEPVFKPLPQPTYKPKAPVKSEPRGLLARMFGRRR